MEKMTPQKLVDQILEAAERERASDVHIEPGKDDVIIKFRIDGILSICVSFFQTIIGEAVVLRILNRSELLESVSQLGFDKHDEQLINKLIISPYGMILASG